MIARRSVSAAAPISLDVHTLDLRDGSALVGSDLHAWLGVWTTAMSSFIWACQKLKPAVVVLDGEHSRRRHAQPVPAQRMGIAPDAGGRGYGCTGLQSAVRVLRAEPTGLASSLMSRQSSQPPRSNRVLQVGFGRPPPHRMPQPRPSNASS